MIRKVQHFAPSLCCMFSPKTMKYELKPHLRVQAQCKVLRQSFGANFPPWPCSALLGPSPTISRQESKSCRTEDRVSGSSPQPSTFQEKNIHTFRQCITELDWVSDQLHFKILLFGIAHWCREVEDYSPIWAVSLSHNQIAMQTFA